MNDSSEKDLLLLAVLDQAVADVDRRVLTARADAGALHVIRDSLRLGRRDAPDTMKLLDEMFPDPDRNWAEFLRSRNLADELLELTVQFEDAA